MKSNEIRELNDRELLDKLKNERLNLTRLRMAHGVSPLQNPRQINLSRRVVARILTEVRKRQIEKGANS